MEITANCVGGTTIVFVVLFDAFLARLGSAEVFWTVDVCAHYLSSLLSATLSAVTRRAAHSTERCAVQILAGFQNFVFVETFFSVSGGEIGTLVARRENLNNSSIRFQIKNKNLMVTRIWLMNEFDGISRLRTVKYQLVL